MRQFGVAHEIQKPIHEQWRKTRRIFICRIFICRIFICRLFNMSKQFSAPGVLSAECVQISIM